MRVRIMKWGNSLALRVPAAFAREMGMAKETEVDLSVEAGRMVVTPLAPPEYSLDTLLAGVTPENRHGEVDSGAPRGREAW